MRICNSDDILDKSAIKFPNSFEFFELWCNFFVPGKLYSKQSVYEKEIYLFLEIEKLEKRYQLGGPARPHGRKVLGYLKFIGADCDGCIQTKFIWNNIPPHAVWKRVL